MSDSDAKVARGMAALYIANVTTLVLNTLFLVLLTNYYSTDQGMVGLVSILNVMLVSAATVSVLALPLVGSGHVATPPAVARFISLYKGEGGRSGRRVYVLSLALCGGISVAILAVGAYSPVAGLVSGPTEAGAVFFACLDALVYSFGQLGGYAMLGNGKATAAGKLIVASSVLRYAFASILVLLGMGPSGVFIGFAFGDSLLAVGANLQTLRSTQGLPKGTEPMGPVLKYMASVFAAALMGLAVSQTDKILAFLQLGLSSLAVYNIATVGAAVASFVSTAATNVLVPSLARSDADDVEKLRLLRGYTRHISLAAMPIGFELAGLSPFLLRLFGDPYASGAPTMAVIAISIALTAVTAVYASVLLVYDKAHHFTLSNLLGLAGLFIIAILAAPSQGFFGIAMGRGAMLLIIMGTTAYFASRLGKLVLDTGAYVKSLGAAAMMAAVIYGVLTFATSLSLGRLAVVGLSILGVPLGLLLYLGLMKAMNAFNEEDMDFVDTLIPGWLAPLSKLARRLL